MATGGVEVYIQTDTRTCTWCVLDDLLVVHVLLIVSGMHVNEAHCLCACLAGSRVTKSWWTRAKQFRAELRSYSHAVWTPYMYAYIYLYSTVAGTLLWQCLICMDAYWCR